MSLSIKRMWIGLIILQLFLLSMLIFLKPIYAIALILGVGCLIYLLWGSEQLPKAILLTVLISGILLETQRRFLIKVEELPIIFVVGFVLINRLLGKESTAKIGPTGRWLTFFLLAVALSAVIGTQQGRGFREVGGEFIVYFYYLLFFLVIESDISEQWMKYIIYGVIGVAAVVTFEYIWIYRATGGAQRVVTDQQHILNVGIPLLFSCLLYEKRVERKLFLSLLLIPMGFAVLVTLTRMLWASIPLSLFLILFLYLRSEKARARHFVYAGVGTAVVVFFLLFPIKELLTRQVTLQYAVKRRLTSLTRLRIDFSFLGRLELTSYVLPRIKRHPIFGTGLGDEVSYKITPLIYPGVSFEKYSYKPILSVKWLDSSYLQLLWKTGVIGFLLFIGLYAVFIKRCFFVFKNTTNDFIKWSSLGIFVGFLALLVIAFLSAILVGYRFNLTWATLMGIIELHAQRIERKI